MAKRKPRQCDICGWEEDRLVLRPGYRRKTRVRILPKKQFGTHHQKEWRCKYCHSLLQRSVGNPKRFKRPPEHHQKNWVCYKANDVICEAICLGRQRRKEWSYCTRKCPCFLPQPKSGVTTIDQETLEV